VSEVITGEAVPLELRLARLPSRMLAFLVDGSIQVALFLIAVALGASVTAIGDSSLTSAYAILVLAMIFVGLPAGVETLSHGRSLGKLMMGLRVVRDDGGPIRFRHALARALAAFFIDIWVLGWLGIGIFTSILSERGKRVGDYMAGTVVLRERVPRQEYSPAPQMPERLAGWAAGLELSSLPGELALAARQYLARYPSLEPGAAAAIGQRLATEVARYIGQPVPPGVPPWAFLSAVLAERRRREVARMRTAQTPGQPSYATPPARALRQPGPPGSAAPAPTTADPTTAADDDPFAVPG